MISIAVNAMHIELSMFQTEYNVYGEYAMKIVEIMLKGNLNLENQTY